MAAYRDVYATSEAFNGVYTFTEKWDWYFTIYTPSAFPAKRAVVVTGKQYDYPLEESYVPPVRTDTDPSGYANIQIPRVPNGYSHHIGSWFYFGGRAECVISRVSSVSPKWIYHQNGGEYIVSQVGASYISGFSIEARMPDSVGSGTTIRGGWKQYYYPPDSVEPYVQRDTPVASQGADILFPEGFRYLSYPEVAWYTGSGEFPSPEYVAAHYAAVSPGGAPRLAELWNITLPIYWRPTHFFEVDALERFFSAPYFSGGAWHPWKTTPDGDPSHRIRDPNSPYGYLLDTWDYANGDYHEYDYTTITYSLLDFKLYAKFRFGNTGGADEGTGPTNLVTRFGTYHRAVATEEGIDTFRADLPMLEESRTTFTGGGPVTAPNLSEDEHGTLWMAYTQSALVSPITCLVFSNDDGITWGGALSMIPGGTHPRIKHKRGMALFAVYFEQDAGTGYIKGRYRADGDTDWSEIFTMVDQDGELITVSDDTFDITPAEDGSDRWLMVVIAEDQSVKEYWSADDTGQTWEAWV